ncbi:MAG: hypothetical protein KKD63_00240 [Proteobacteria bacterium]|nr:hypothetical protein [Desulfobulbaceae bacterium]MBU4151285.1 hypothetical protein [Pseudomonadota bacterium]
MKIDRVIDYRALTADHFTTYPQPDHIRKLVEQNRNTLAQIAATAGDTIVRQAQADARRALLGGSVDLMV